MVAFHELFGQPTRKPADYDCCKPANLLFFHKPVSLLISRDWLKITTAGNYGLGNSSLGTT
jgi:hypothetical protein